MTRDMGSHQIVASPSVAKRPLLRISELAEALGISRRQAYGWVATAVIPREAIIRAGRAIYVKRPAFEQWLAGRDGVAPPGQT
jgi:predicted DNA-binding transcriptional regulator AlpA